MVCWPSINYHWSLTKSVKWSTCNNKYVIQEIFQSITFWKMKILKLLCSLWRPVLVKIMTINLHSESILIQLQQILWTCCVFLSSLNNTFFIVLVIIFSNKSYFCFNYTNTLFIHSMNYFSFFGLQCNVGLAFEVDWFRVFDLLWPFWKLCKWRSTFKENATTKHCQRKKQKRFSSFLQNLSGASSLLLVMRFSGPKI